MKTGHLLYRHGSLRNTYPRGFSLPTVAVSFPKLDGDGSARRMWVLVTVLQTLACLGLFSEDKGPLG